MKAHDVDKALRQKFVTEGHRLGNQDRRKKLKRLLTASDDEAAIDMKMLAVLVGSELASLFPVLRAICHAHPSRSANLA